MKTVCVIDLDETLGHFTGGHEFLVRPYAHLLLDFLAVVEIDLILWSYGSDQYVEHVINTCFDIFVHPDIRTRIFGRTVCETSKRRYGFTKHSQVIRKLYLDDIHLMGLDDRININMDTGYDFRVQVEPYDGKNKQDKELFETMCKIIAHLKEHRTS